MPVSKTFAIFLYADGEIQWTTGDNDNGVHGLEGYPAQVGFNKGDDEHFGIVATSGTESIIDIPFTNNSGVYIFRISDNNIEVETGNNYTVYVIYLVVVLFWQFGESHKHRQIKCML